MSSSPAPADGATPELELIPGGGDQLGKWKRLLSEVEDRRQAALALMEAELADAEAELDKLDERRDELKAAVTQARRAVIALRAVEEDPAPRREPAKPKSKKKDWNVTPARMEDILQRMVEVNEPISPTQLAKRVGGVSFETASKAMEALRAEGRVRFVRKTKGGGSLYEPMPEEYDAAAAAAGADA